MWGPHLSVSCKHTFFQLCEFAQNIIGKMQLNQKVVDFRSWSRQKTEFGDFLPCKCVETSTVKSRQWSSNLKICHLSNLAQDRVFFLRLTFLGTPELKLHHSRFPELVFLHLVLPFLISGVQVIILQRNGSSRVGRAAFPLIAKLAVRNEVRTNPIKFFVVVSSRSVGSR